MERVSSKSNLEAQSNHALLSSIFRKEAWWHRLLQQQLLLCSLLLQWEDESGRVAHME